VGGRVRDQDGGVSEYTGSVTVMNVAPTPTVNPAATPYWARPVTLSGSATDPSGADTSAGFSPTWAFGDSSTGTGFSVTHSYTLPGVYTATLTVTDKDNGSRSASTQVTVVNRPSALTYTGATTATFGYAATLSARFSEAVDAATAQLEGRVVTFTINGTTFTATTNASGVATAIAPQLLPPGSYPIAIGFATDALYTASSAQATLVVTNAPSGGKVTGGGLRTPNGGKGGFNVAVTGSAVTGELQFQATGINFHAHTLTALGISADGKSAWFSGVGDTGATFTAFVEDNGEPGTNDVFKLWIGGILQNGDGKMAGGNIQVHK
jgi:PKD repeat protein